MNYYGYPQPSYATGAHPSYVTGDLSDVNIPGLLIPPLGFYQAFRDHPSDAQNRSLTAPPEKPSSFKPVLTKLAIVAGGALAVYLIYVASKAAIPMHERAGGAAAKFLGARYGLKKPEARSMRSTILPPEPRLPRAAEPLAFGPRPPSRRSSVGSAIRDAEIYHPRQSSSANSLLGAIDYYAPSSERR